MTSDFIKQKSITGAKWTIIISAFALPLNYFLNMILGRVSPEVLGTYASIQIFIQALPVFVLFSGASILANFIPKIQKKDNIPKFLFTYNVIIIITMVFFITALFFSPSVFRFLFKQNITKLLFYFLLAFIPVCTLFQMVLHSLYGILEIKISSILGRIQLFGLSIIVIFFVTFQKKIFESNYFSIILTSVFFFNMIGFIIGAGVLLRRVNFSKAFSFYLPAGFWRFSFSLQLGSLFAYGFTNIDRLFVLKLGDLNQLGLYQAVISIWMLIDFFPQLLLRVLVPMFSSYIAQGDKETIKKSYSIIERYCIFVAISVGIFIVSFSKELLSIFGEQYTDNYLFLIILAVGSSFGTLQYVNNPLLISTEKNKERVLNSVIRIGIQLLLTLLLLEKFGVLGIVLARVSALVAGQIIPIYVVTKKLPYDIKVPREFYFGSLSMLLCGGLCCIAGEHNIIYSMSVFSLVILLFIISAHYRLNDLKFVFNLILGKR